MTDEMIKNINKAIRIVLTTQFKKDAKESHELLESLGYTISKHNGAFFVHNPKTNKSVRTNGRRIVYGRNDVNSYYYENHNYVSRLDKFNFYNCLETPVNPDWNDYHCKCSQWSYEYNHYSKNNIQQEFENNKALLKDATWSVKYYTSEVNRVQKELNETIARLQKDLVRYTERKVYEEQRLANLRESFKK